MRLRYLQLPRCGPLTDTAVVFGREELIAKALSLPRQGSLNFVVGVNGSGKSTILRVLYRIFRSLNLRERPTLPMTLAWDRSTDSDGVTALLHVTNRKDCHSFFAICKQIPSSARHQEWEAITAALANKESHPLITDLETISGQDAFTSPLLLAHLPKRLIAYTSGAGEPWEHLDQPVFHPKMEEEGQLQAEDDRPHGWSMEREWEEEHPLRVSNVLTRYAWGTERSKYSVPTAIADLTGETVERLREELGPLEEIRRKVLTNHMSRSEKLDGFFFRLDPSQLRYAGITLGLWQTAKELADCGEEKQREALRDTLINQRASDAQAKDARRVLNEIDWFWPTHLSLTYHDAGDLVGTRQHEELLCLVALADEVIAQPRGRHRAVFSLGPSDRINLGKKLKAASYSMPSSGIDIITKRVDGSKTGAEAILRILSSDRDIDSTPMEVFTRLRDWERTGLLEEITVTVKRLHSTEDAEGKPDDVIVTYDQLSDGEQMLLCRMGLLFLLRGQDGSLLLLDEPETHFNDVWKREIVEMIDMGLLNSTRANVIVATHTSIALTDAFAAEVTVLDKNRESGVTTARGVKGGLFGTDPGEVNMNLFGADSSIGSRSVELLDQLLKTEWQGRENELEEILNVLGSSFHRAELRAILKQLRAKNDGPASR